MTRAELISKQAAGTIAGFTEKAVVRPAGRKGPGYSKDGKPAKYGNRRTEVDNIWFDSAKEAKEYGILRMRERAGEITDLKLQPEFPIIIMGDQVARYIADFSFVEKGELKIVDVKGVRTPTYRLKKKLVERQYSITIIEV